MTDFYRLIYTILLIKKKEAKKLDCEQSLFFFRFSKGSARARARHAKRGRPLPSRAISYARGHFRVSRFARRTTEKREPARSL